METVTDEEFDSAGNLISATPRAALSPLRQPERIKVGQAIKQFMDICEAAQAGTGPNPTAVQTWRALYALCQYAAWDARQIAQEGP